MVHTFKLHGLSLALDVESGAVHVLDEPAFWAVRELAGGLAVEDVGSMLKERYGANTAREILVEIADLQERGLLFSKKRPLHTLPDGVVKALCLHLAHDCNLRCRYCFASGGDFGGTRSLMSASVARQAVDFLLAASGGRRHCEIDFFGGEPLLNFTVLRETVAYGRGRSRELGKKLKFTVTTNAFSLSQEVQEYLNREGLSVVLSLDGRQEVHDRMRRQPDGSGSFGAVLANCRELVAGRGGDNYYLRGTYTRYNLDFAEDVLAMINEGFDCLSLEPAVLAPESAEALQLADLTLLEAEYERLVEMLWQLDQNGRPVRFFHFELDLIQGPCAGKRVQGCGAGAAYLAVTPDGRLYPCHQFVGVEGFCAGHLDTGVRPEVLARFKEVDSADKEPCRDCFARFFCGGGCHAAAWLQNGTLDEPYALACALHRKRVECGLYLQARRRLVQTE
ncbi:MAG: thioether cross-link-forming SCIFF peptide maturase [Firmicutes bacterium]|nr:thioether cross-link-forming SCIFF peptide maturase [Bacillota bacterium]